MTNAKLNPSRREIIWRGMLGTAGMLVGSRFAAGGLAATTRPVTPGAAKARSVIQIWLWGGPCHLDTFDPKPEAGSDYTGPLSGAIETNVRGIRIGESLPLLAKQASKYALVRSLTHSINAHETAAYAVQTGRAPGGTVVYPGTGAVVSLFKGYDAGYKGLIPPYIVLTELQGRFSEAGFLPVRYKPFATGGDPAQPRFMVEGVVSRGISPERQQARRDLLHDLDALHSALPANQAIVDADRAGEQAYELILGDGAKVFDLAEEKDAVREHYGRNTFGQSCLMARRLVERGVPYITINYKGWDTHKQHFPAMRRMLPELDRGIAALIEDLAAKGLLDSTIVWCSGEFGRTPKVQWEAPWNGGRGHFGQAFSALLAGGGFNGGQVVGATGPRGEEVKDRPVAPHDLIASIYHQLGIPLEATLQHPQGEKLPLLPGSPKLLKEIM